MTISFRLKIDQIEFNLPIFIRPRFSRPFVILVWCRTTGAMATTVSRRVSSEYDRLTFPSAFTSGI